MKLLTIAQAVERSGLSTAYVHRACQSEWIGGVFQVGRMWLIPRDAFDEWNSGRRPRGNPNWRRKREETLAF